MNDLRERSPNLRKVFLVMLSTPSDGLILRFPVEQGFVQSGDRIGHWIDYFGDCTLDLNFRLRRIGRSIWNLFPHIGRSSAQREKRFEFIYTHAICVNSGKNAISRLEVRVHLGKLIAQTVLAGINQNYLKRGQQGLSGVQRCFDASICCALLRKTVPPRFLTYLPSNDRCRNEDCNCAEDTLSPPRQMLIVVCPRINAWPSYCEYSHRESKEPNPSQDSQSYLHVNVGGVFGDNRIMPITHARKSVFGWHPPTTFATTPGKSLGEKL
ncbi:hypothetical protein [uncultured Xylophilus sp.]|uniref:hypothetical protein n=1 Tax=uncultured Xylophilus sp. TaxID=296832 RepID=UPI0025FD98C4|nr:hypothetical protein [uncultured Xylophilus sp.]